MTYMYEQVLCVLLYTLCCNVMSTIIIKHIIVITVVIVIRNVCSLQTINQFSIHHLLMLLLSAMT